MKYIERHFPILEVNLMAEYDMAFQRGSKELREKLNSLLGVEAKAFRPPRINNLAYYPARIPPSATRAITLASVLENSIEKETFLKALGFEKAKELAASSGALITLYMVDPDRELVRELLGKDPKDVTVVDPMAGGGSIPLESIRLGFRTIAGDYNPFAFLILRATIEFPAKYGKRLFELVRREAKALINYAKRELGQFYSSNTKNYLFFTGAEHGCGGVVPLAKHTLLSKKKDIHVKPVFDKKEKKLFFGISEGSPAFTPAICPYCNNSVSEMEIRRKWVKNHIDIIEKLLDGKVEEAEKVSNVYIMASVQIGRGKYRVADENDRLMLIKAAEELARCAVMEKENGGDIRDYIPFAEITENNEVFNKLRNYGIRFWYQLFNPRQLLVMYKLTKYIRTRAEELCKTYGELGAATVLYLALALTKVFNYNNILTQWDAGDESVRDLAGSQYALGRKVNLGYDYLDVNVTDVTLPWALEAKDDENENEDAEEVESTRGGILPVLRLLCNKLEGLWKEGLDSIYLWDARELDKHLPEKSVDLINVDPPYYDQHDYSGISEFFWIIVQQALWPVLDILFPNERIKLNNWRPEYPEIPRDIELKGNPPAKVGEASNFGENFELFLNAASKTLKDDGLLVVWYAYGKLHGWEELFYRFWNAEFGVTKTWLVWTQSRQRRVALQKSAFFTSMVIVAKPRVERIKLLSLEDPIFLEDVRRTVKNSMDYLLSSYGFDALKEALVVSLADGFARVTFYTFITDLGAYTLLSQTALKIATSSAMEILASHAGVSELNFSGLDAVSRLYTFLLIASTDDLRVSSDFANRIHQVLGVAGLSIASLRSGGNRGSIRLLSPSEVARKFPAYTIGESISLIEKVREAYKKHGVRAAEDIVMNSDPLALSLSRLLLTTSFNKLGLSISERDEILSILAKGGVV